MSYPYDIKSGSVLIGEEKTIVILTDVFYVRGHCYFYMVLGTVYVGSKMWMVDISKESWERRGWTLIP